MKRISLIILATAIAMISAAQDTIILRTGKLQLATIKMVDRTSVQYQDWLQPDGYTYLMDIDKIKELRYHDGRHINFVPEEKPAVEIPQRAFAVNPPYKNPAVAFAFSSLPGLGQFYNDEIGKGLWFMGIGVVSSVVLGVSASNLTKEGSSNSNTEENNSAAVVLLSGFALFVDYVAATIDAVSTANKKNKANGYVVSLAPNIQYNTMASADGGSGLIPSLSLKLTF